MDEMNNRFLNGLDPLDMERIVNTIGQMDDIGEIFSLVRDIDQMRRCLNPLTVYSKSDPDAESCRTKGNILYKNCNIKEALEEYNGSILLAPHPDLRVYDETSDVEDSNSSTAGIRCMPVQCSDDELKKYKTLALGYANRSAVFLSLKKFDQCLSDIDMALKYGYPEEMIDKLKERRTRCLKAKKESGQERQEADIVSNNMKVPPKLRDPNPTIPSFSSAINVACSLAKGKHVVAARDILPGELITVEKSYCSRVYSIPEAFCLVCLMQCQNFIPCPSCCMAVFCSDTCRAKGLKEHMRECKTFSLMQALDLEEDPIACMAMKLVVETTFAELKEKLPLLKKESKTLPLVKQGYNENGLFMSSDYRAVYHTASSQRRVKDPAVIFAYAVKAVVITNALQQSRDFFVTRDGLLMRPYREDFILTGTALLHQMMHCKSLMCISDIKVDYRDATIQKKVVGNALYPALSLMRHSCNPPTVFYNFGHVKIVRTVMPIKAGQEVTLSLIDRYQTLPLLLRVMKMSVTGIECSCEACLGKWPSEPGISKEVNIKCIKCDIPIHGMWVKPHCLACGIDYCKLDSQGKRNKKNNSLVAKWWAIVEKVIEGQEKFDLLRRKLQTGQKVTKQDYKFICSFSNLIGKHAEEPSIIFCLLRDSMLLLFYKGF